jgi:RNA polymerase sigma factor (sigma-70 family)
MDSGELREVLRRLRLAVRPGEAGGLADAELLRRWLEARDEAAFEVLVWRHGPIVLGVCRRLLHNAEEAEDAFQATWLALVRHGASIRGRHAVGSWLYRVACRVALSARTAGARRRTCAPQIGDAIAAPPGPDPAWRDLCAVLDEEVNRLPEKLRAPLVLCYFGGRTNEEAARELGRPVGTVVSRLVRARRRLHDRLRRRGVSLTAGAAGAALAENVAMAEMSGLSVGTAVRAAGLTAAGKGLAGAVTPKAAALAQGVLRAMLWTKLKVGAAVLLAGGLLSGSGVFTYRTGATQPDVPAKAQEPPLQKPAPGALDVKQLVEERNDLRRRLEDAELRIRQLQQRMEVGMAAAEDRLKVAQKEYEAVLQRVVLLSRQLEEARKQRPTQATDLRQQFGGSIPPIPPRREEPRVEVIAARERENAERLDEVQFEVGLLEAQREAKEAQLQTARRLFELAGKAAQNGTGSPEKAIVQEGQVQLFLSELKENQLRLVRAQRRLNALKESAAATQRSDTPRSNLEKRVDALAKELEALRQEMRRSRP